MATITVSLWHVLIMTYMNHHYNVFDLSTIMSYFIGMYEMEVGYEDFL